MVHGLEPFHMVRIAQEFGPTFGGMFRAASTGPTELVLQNRVPTYSSKPELSAPACMKLSSTFLERN